MCAEKNYFNQERMMKKLVCASAVFAMLICGAASAGVGGVSGGGKVALGVSGGGKP